MISRLTQKWLVTLTVVVFFIALAPGFGFSQQEKKQSTTFKSFFNKPLTPLVTSTVGEKKNYNLENYTQYEIGTIEWEVGENRYHARVGFTGAEGFVYFNSYHQDFADAERTINFVKDGKTSGKLYNIFAQTIVINSTPTPGPHGETTVVEVLSLIYSFSL